MNYSKITITEHPFLEVLECCGESEEKNAVKTLYYRGILPNPRPPVVAIVGARRSTKYGEEIAYRAAYELAKRGVVVVSGMAYGIDACAHRGCLDAGGITVAVLGTPINKLYPSGNTELGKRILERGAIISEYAPGTETRAYYFQVRNRIVSGLADAVLIVEASKHSGTYGTYESALKQGKNIFVVPGDITRPMSEGTNDMLAQGANIYREVQDIMTSFGRYAGKPEEASLDGLPEQTQKVYRAIKRGITDPDAIIKELKMMPIEFNTNISRLELADLVIFRDGKWSLK